MSIRCFVPPLLDKCILQFDCELRQAIRNLLLLDSTQQRCNLAIHPQAGLKSEIRLAGARHSFL